MAAQLKNSKTAKEKDKLVENYIFNRTSSELDPRTELRDHLERADELMQKLKTMQSFQLYDPLAQNQGGVLLQ